MKDKNPIPIEFKKRLLFFKNMVSEQFSFIQDFNYILDKVEIGQKENFKDYFFEFTYANGDTVIKIHFSTDIINGIKMAFPKSEEKELPGVDSQITCFICDKNAFMSIDSFIETKFPEISTDDFTIKSGSSDLELEIIRVVKNYSNFFKTNLTAVLEKRTIYDCYTDRFYDKVFKEIRYR